MSSSHHQSGRDAYVSHMGAAPEPPRFFSRRMAIMLAIVAVILTLVFGFIFGMKMIVANFMKNMPREQTVSTVQAKPLVWQGKITAVGSLHAVEGADMAAEVAGIVTRIGFTAGEDVKKGALLVQLRDDSERAAADQALLAYRRAEALIKTKAISQSDYDDAKATMRSTQAALEKKAIRAPFAGRVGIRKVDLGQYVAAGTTVVTLQQLDPIYVDFKLSQQQLAQVQVGSHITMTSDMLPGQAFDGEVVALDPKVDDATRTLAVRALVHNPGKRLLPGMFASVTVTVGKPQSYLTLPQTAITYNPYGDTVYLVQKETVDGKPALVAQQRFVTLGETRGDQVAVLSGITAKDVVVSTGQMKLKNGMAVVVNNTVRLPNDADPRPVQR